MMPERDPEALVRAMAEEVIPAEPKEVLHARRERTVPVIGRAIRQAYLERERRQRWRRALLVGAAAAALLGIGFGGYRALDGLEGTRVEAHAGVATVKSVTGALLVTHAGRPRVVAAGESLQLGAGDELRTPVDGRAELKTERSAIDVARATQLSVLAPSSAEERIRLAIGRVDLHVSKNAPVPRSVVVETPDAEVIVRGTVFSVTVAEENGARSTRVRVTEGSVWVLSRGAREILSAGEEWSSLAQPKERSAQSPAAEKTAPEPGEARSRAAGGDRQRARGKAAVAANGQERVSGTLAEENRLFQAAIDARNRGDDRKAIELFGTLLARYPKSVVAEEAKVERMRALRRAGDAARASAEARRYLAEHASGFAREEARETALSGK